MQEIWQEVSDNKSIYSRLWSFGVQSLRSRECGLYEASDLLLGNQLTEKSATIKWIDVSMPQKRSRRLKDLRELEQLAQHDPNNKDIYEEIELESIGHTLSQATGESARRLSLRLGGQLLVAKY